MNDRSTHFSDNPLYEKLYNRFSYSGKTVGEMMLYRAREAAGSVGAREKDELRDITAEIRITRANFLPRVTEGGSAVAIHRARPAFSMKRINPFAALALLISVLILSYLLVSGIRHHMPTADDAFLSVNESDVNLYAAEADTTPIL